MHRWIAEAIIYQVNLRAFASREPRNPVEAAHTGDPHTSPLAYLTEHLSTLRDLGINVLHLMPPFAMGIEDRKGIGSPYAVRDYTKIDPEFGTIDELRALIRTAHAAGLKVILGMVPNHTSRDNVWVDGHPEYYVKDAKNRIAFDLDWTDTAKLDYRVPAVRQAMAEVCELWLSFLGPNENGHADGVDGFRFDMAHFINDVSFWNETLPRLQEQHPDRELLFLAECYGMENNLDLFTRGINAAYDDEFYKVCEYFYGLDAEGQTVLLPSLEVYGNRDLKERYDIFNTEGIAGVMENALLQYENVLAADADTPRLARYTDNHDEGRGLYRYGPGAMRAVNQLIFFGPHTIPFLLTGQEFGALNRPSIHDRIRPCEKGRRILTERRVSWWDGVEFEGTLFARTAAERANWRAFYRELIQLRLATAELIRGDFALLDVGENCPHTNRSVIAFERSLYGRTVRCAVNLGPDAHPLQAAHLLQGRPLYGRMEGNTLHPFSGYVVRPGA